MSASLPARPDLGQLRRRAKELRDAARRGDGAAAERLARHHSPARDGTVSLAGAQLVIARELGFTSWPALKAAVVAAVFADASVEGRMGQAQAIVRADPAIARRGMAAAAVLGDAEAVRERLAADPAAAVAVDDERGWPPLLYACYSRWHVIDQSRAAGLAAVVRLLLDAGASANTNDGGRLRYRSALRGSVEVNNPAITRVLLAAGASPDPGQPIGEAAGHRDPRCLRLLLAHGARVAGTWAVDAAVSADDPVAVTLLLGALDAAAAASAASAALPEAAGHASAPVIAALIDAGADPRAADEAGVPAARLAVRAGKDEIAARLRELGADWDVTAADRFTGACRGGDRVAAERLLAEHPGLAGRLTERDLAVIVDDAASAPALTLALMLELGFPFDARNDLGEQPLHTAAYHGNTAAVRVLIDAGAEIDARDTRFDATPLAYATVGSGERAGRPGDWLGTVRLLVEAGASRADVWIARKPPSEQVAGLLRHYGIGPGEPPAETAPPAVPGAAGTGVMADIAAHLEAAYREGDLDLLSSLLDPRVRWTGLCAGSAAVIDWYRSLLAEGTAADVESAEVDGDTIVLTLTVTSPARGARPAPPQRLRQAFAVAGHQIIEIRPGPASGS